MQIISGQFKHRKIPTTRNVKYRPTSGRLKEALFSILTSGEFAEKWNKGPKFLDIYSGSGAIGFEALSRGAGYSSFIDMDRENIEIAKKFALDLGLEKKTSFLCADATNLRYRNLRYDLVFIDPPYRENMIPKTLSSLVSNSWLEENALIILELANSENLGLENCFSTIMERKYGSTRLMILRYLNNIL